MLKIAGCSDESESTESRVFSHEMVRHTKQAIVMRESAAARGSSNTTIQPLNIKLFQLIAQQLKSRINDSLSPSTIAILGAIYSIFFSITH